MENYIKEVVEEIINNKVDGNTDLIEAGLNSIGILKMISLLEDHYGIEIEDEDFILENLYSIDTISRMVSKYLDN